MPLDLDETSINTFSGAPRWRQFANLVRAAIVDGRLQPDETLPSEPELAAMVGTSRDTVRRGLDLLRSEGLIVKRSGIGSRVAPPAPVRHMATERYRKTMSTLRSLEPGEPYPLTSAFVEDHGVTWKDHGVQPAYATEPATDEDADRLAIEPGAPVLRRHLLKLVRGVPVQLQESVIPLELVAGTPVEDPARQPWPGGTLHELWSVGLEVTRVSEVATARLPTDEERRRLHMETQGPVHDIVRTFYAGLGDERRPVEVSTVVCPAAGMELRYETDLT